MPENILKIPLRELETIRLVCQRENCGGVAEIPARRLEALVGQVQCPSCSQPFSIKHVGNISGLKALGMAVKNLTDENDFSVEFLLSDS